MTSNENQISGPLPCKPEAPIRSDFGPRRGDWCSAFVEWRDGGFSRCCLEHGHEGDHYNHGTRLRWHDSGQRGGK